MSKRNTDALPKLSQELRRRMKQNGINVAEAARRLGLNERSFRSWLLQNRFPKAVAQESARLVDLPSDLSELQTQYSFALPKRARDIHIDVKHKQTQLARSATDSSDSAPGSLLQVTDLFEERFRQATKSYFTDFEQDVEAIFNAMGSGDIFVYCSLDELPMETLPVNSRAILPLVANAVRNGAYFIYIYPDDSVIARLEECRIRPTVYPQHFAENLTLLQEKLAKHVSSRDINQYLIAIPTSLCAFMVPGHKYVLYRPNTSTPSPPPLQLCFDPFYRHLPLSDHVSNAFLGYIDVVFKTAGRNDLRSLFI
jgi:transposase-like protein